MAAQVEVQTGDVAGGRLHLSPLTDSSNKSLIEIPSISESHFMSSESDKPVPNPKPRLTPKPFVVDKNPTIKPILAPKPQTKPRPESTRLAGVKPDLPNAPKPTPRQASTHPNRPAPTTYKTSNKLNTGQTNKPVVQPFKPAPSIDLADISKPTRPVPAQRHKPAASSLAYSKSLKSLPAAEWSGTTTKENESRQNGLNKEGPAITRAKSMGFLAEAVQEEEKQQVKTQPEVSVPLRPQPRGSRPRPVSAIFPGTPTKTEIPIPSPQWTGRRPLSADLTSKFESIGLSLHRSPKAGSKENTPTEKKQSPKTEQDKSSQSFEGVTDLTVPDKNDKRAEESIVKDTEEEKHIGSIKSRISLLLDSSPSPVTGTTGHDLRSTVQPVPETEPAVGVKTLIKQLTEDVSPTQSPVVKPVLKPRPLPLDLTKRFSSEKSPDIVSVTEDLQEISKDPQRGAEESALTPNDQMFLDLRISSDLLKKSSTPECSETGQVQATSKEDGADGEVHAVKASLFENIVERQSVLVMDQGESANTTRDPLSSILLNKEDSEDEGTLVTATYKEPMSPSSPFRVFHAFDTLQAVEENKAVVESVPAAKWEDKALTLRSRRSEMSRPMVERSDPAQAQLKLEQQPRYLRIGALKKWTTTSFEQEAGVDKGMLNDSDGERQVALDRDGLRAADQDEMAAAPKRLKMLQAEEQPKPRATYFALTGQMQESGSVGSGGTSFGDMSALLDDFSVRSALGSSQGKSFPVRRNLSVKETFGKPTQFHNTLDEPMPRSNSLPMEIRSQMEKQTKEEIIEAEKKRELTTDAERHRAKMRELEKEKLKFLEMEKRRMKEWEMQREFERQRQKAFEKEELELEEKQQAMEKLKQIELEKQKLQVLEKKKQRETERERQRQLLKEKQLELERREQEREREREKERQRQKEEERQRQLDKERQIMEMERIKEMERQQVLEFQKQKQKEMDRQQMELEKQRLKEKAEKEEERLKQMALEQEMLRIKELEKEKELQRQVDMEKQRQSDLEKEKEREKERQRQKEEEKQRQIEKENKMKEMERIKEIERQRVLEFQKQKQKEKERQQLIELEKQRLKENAEKEAERLRQMALEQERLRIKELEKEKARIKEMEHQMAIKREKQRDLEIQRRSDLEREQQRQLDIERQQIEIERQRREQEKERKRKEDLESLKEMERKQLLEFEKVKPAEQLEFEKLRLEEKMEKEEVEKIRQVAKQQEAERQRLKEKQKKEEQERIRLESSAMRPKVLDLDSVLRNDPPSSPRSDPSTRWREPYKPVILDIDSFTSQTQASPSKDLFPVSGIWGPNAESGGRLQPTPERDVNWKVPSYASVGFSSPVWTASPQDPWELRPVETTVEKPVTEPNKPANKLTPEQLLFKQEERLPNPQRHWPVFPDEPPFMAPSPRMIPKTGNSPREVSTSTLGEQIWVPRELQPPQKSRGEAASHRKSHGSKELNRLRSRSMSRRSAPSSSAVEASLSRMRSRSAHREEDRPSLVQQNQSSENKGKGSETPVHDTDSQYGTWETGLRSDDSLTPATPSSESNLSLSPRKPTPHSPAHLSSDTLDGAPALSSSESQPLPFPEAPLALLDNSVLRSRAQLGKKRAPRTRPSKTSRASAAQVQEGGGTTEDWLYRDSTEPKAEGKDDDSEPEEKTRGADSGPAVVSQPQRVALFPGVDPSALKAQLKKRSDSETDGPIPSPSHLSRSPKSPFLRRATRVLPPPGGKENSEEDSPQWLKELKSKKRLSQYESET